MSLTNFSVVVISHERKTRLRRLVDSIENAAKTYDGNTEIIVVNSSREKSFYECNHIREIHVPTKIKAATKRNIGLSRARYEWIIFIDDDCILRRDALKIIAKHSESADSNTVGFYGVTNFSGPIKYALRSCDHTEFTNDFYWASKGVELPWGPTSIAIFKKSALIAIGGFDENFSVPAGGEDVDIGIRINKQNLRLYGIPSTLVFHDSNSWNSYIGNLKRFLRYGIADVDLQIKHGDCICLKLNSLFFILLPLLILLFGYGILNCDNIRLLFMTTVYFIDLTLFRTIWYRTEYNKSFKEAIGLTGYGLSYEIGILLASLKKLKVKALLFRFSYQVKESRKQTLGRDKLIDTSEIFDVLGMLTSIVIIILFNKLI